MKKHLIKIFSVLLTLAMLLSFAACGSTEDNNNDNGNNQNNANNNTSNNSSNTGNNNAGNNNTGDNSDNGTTEPDKDLEIKIYSLNGTTALGFAQMIDSVNNNTASMKYDISLHAAADTITGSIVSGECAIAALPTNAAAKLYKASQGKIKLLALNTLGVLYLLQGEGENITSLDALRGKTVYLPGAGSNPEFITKALLESAGLTVGTDVFLDTATYASPDALQTAVVAGNAKIAVLPEPKVTVTTNQNAAITVALNLTDEWEKINGENTLVQGCLVVNTKFAEEHPAEIAQFLKDYEASVNTTISGSDEAINMIVNAGILPAAGVAKKALPKCNLCFIAGEDMKTPMNVFCEKIFAQFPNSIGAVPDNNFYYVAK